MLAFVNVVLGCALAGVVSGQIVNTIIDPDPSLSLSTGYLTFPGLTIPYGVTVTITGPPASTTDGVSQSVTSTPTQLSPSSSVSSTPSSSPDSSQGQIASSTSDTAASSSSGSSNAATSQSPITAAATSSSHGGAIAGGVVGGLAGLAVVVALVLFLVRRKNIAKRQRGASYYGNQPSSGYDAAQSGQPPSRWLPSSGRLNRLASTEDALRDPGVTAVAGAAGGSGRNRSGSDESHEMHRRSSGLETSRYNNRESTGAQSVANASSTVFPRASLSRRSSRASENPFANAAAATHTPHSRSGSSSPSGPSVSVSRSPSTTTKLTSRKAVPKYDAEEEEGEEQKSGEASRHRRVSTATTDVLSPPTSLGGSHELSKTISNGSGTLGGMFAGEKDGRVHYLVPDPPMQP